MTQLVGILSVCTLPPAVHQQPESIQLRQRAFRQLQVENHGLCYHAPQTDAVQVSRLHNLSHRRIADATCRIVDDTSECLLVIGVGYHTEVGYHIFDFLTLVEAQPAVNTIRYAVLAHLFLERTALCIGAIQDGEVAVFAAVLPLQPLDVVAHNHRLLTVTIGRLQRYKFAITFHTL